MFASLFRAPIGPQKPTWATLCIAAEATYLPRYLGRRLRATGAGASCIAQLHYRVSTSLLPT